MEALTKKKTKQKKKKQIANQMIKSLEIFLKEIFCPVSIGLCRFILIFLFLL